MKNEFDYLNDVKMDFSVYEEKSLTEKERLKMKNILKRKRKFSTRKCIAAAACVGVVAALGITAYATGFVDNVVKMITTGHNQFAQVDDSELTAEVPENLKGFLFDENGEEVTMFRGDMTLYDKDGNVIEDMGEYMRSLGIYSLYYNTENGEVKVSFDEETESDPLLNMEGDYIIAESEAELENKPGFKASVPEYIPEGFKFHGAAYSKGEAEYLFIYYMNGEGEYFCIHERIINDDTAYTASTNGTVEEIDINGNKAAVMDKDEISWEENGISIDVMGRDVIEYDDLLKVAESIK